MTSPYWAKLWIEILDDPKVADMPDWLFRRFIFFVLAAKEYDREGLLQPVKDLAWRLRISNDECTEALSALSIIGVTRETAEGWLLINFVKRQKKDEATSNALRQRRYRERHRNGSNEEITPLPSVSVSVSDSLIKDSLTEKSIFSIRDAEKAYLQVTGFASVPGGMMPRLENILDLLQHYSWEETINRLTNAKNNWISQKNKSNGAAYKLTNPAWIDYAITGETLGKPPKLSEVDQNIELLKRAADKTK